MNIVFYRKLSNLFSGILLALVTTQANSFEITPLLGYNFGDTLAKTTSGESIKPVASTSLGFIVGFNRDASSQYEFLYSHQDTELRSNSLTPGPTIDLTVDYYHIGGTTLYKSGNLRPFVSGAMGITHLSPGANLSSETRLSFSIGGGVKVPLSERIGLRFEGRGYGTVFDSSAAIFCSGGCVARFSGSVYLQFEAMAGVIIAF